MSIGQELNTPYSQCDYKKVKAVKFGIFSPETCVAMSVCKVEHAEIYEKGMPKRGGLNDSRMGSMDFRVPCETCGMMTRNKGECPGHFGHLELAKPMYHISFLNNVLRVLRSVCFHCSRLLCADDARLKKYAAKLKHPPARLRKVLELSRTKRFCGQDVVPDENQEEQGRSAGGCGSRQPKFSKDISGCKLQIEMPLDEDAEAEGAAPEMKRDLTAEEALTVLKRISREDMILLGFTPDRAEPSWMVLTVIPVPPPPVRPSVQFGNDRSEDDITMKLLDIVKLNIQIRKHENAGASSHILQEYCKTLQFHIFTYVDNSVPGLPISTTRTKKPLKSIRSRLKGKEGRLRCNLMGKRVDFSARTVITGDPNLMIDQVGVPRSVAMTLTFPETVTPLNIDEMRKLVQNGPKEWPGAKHIIREDGTRFDLRYLKGSDIPLEYGYRVERHMRDDDFVMFNRQPSLHKMSIMGHRAKILPFSTFRLNLSVTSPYNADFDGDEMNLHLAQSHETRAEIKHLMLVPRQIVSPQGNRPVMGIVQDALLGISKLTKRDTFLQKDLVMNLLMWLPDWDGTVPPPCILRPTQLWSGKQMITKLLQHKEISIMRWGNIKLKDDHEWFSSNDANVIIQHGEHLAGVIDKKIVGSSSGSCVHIMWHEHGPEKAKEFLSNCQKLVNYWLLQNGFSVGCADIIPNDLTLLKVTETLTESKLQVKEIVRKAQEGSLETQPGMSMLQSFESQVNQVLNKARESSGKIGAESLDDRNNIIAMVNAGSKGSSINISQIIACVGQQNVEGKRVPFGFRKRSLPHFTKDDYGPESRGFVENSYLAGLTPQEFYFHAMGGREGVIDTACKTAETGYIQRRLIKALEDVKVQYDRTIRNSLGEIVQFLYGEDGMAGEFIEDLPMALMTKNPRDFDRMYRHDYTSAKYGEGWLYDSLRNAIRSDATKHGLLEQEYQKLVDCRRLLCREIFPDGETRQHVPVNVERILDNVKWKIGSEAGSEPLDPCKIVQDVDELLEKKLIIVKGNDGISKEVQENATTLLKCHLREALSSKRLLEKDRIGPRAFEWLLGEIDRQFNKSLAHPGEVVGTLAAQSVGEPATQMTLNTFHFAGVGSKNVTLGVPRLREIINLAKNIKTPSLTVYLQPHLATQREVGKDVSTKIEYTTLEKVTAFTQIFYDPDPTTSILPQDKELVEEFWEMSMEEVDTSKYSPWLLRIQLNSKAMVDKKLSMAEVEQCINRTFEGDLHVIATDDNADVLVLRIRIVKHAEAQQNTEEDGEGEPEQELLKRIESNILNQMVMKGVSGIKKVYMRSDPITRFDPVHNKFETVKEWILDTDGKNLKEVLKIEDVDATRTVSNDVIEMFSVFGIEGCRRSLLKEIRNVISFDGSYVNYRHLAILCDVMTQKGHLMAITRHGINRVEKGPLMKASFEETVEILMEAAMFAETDYLRGVSENIIMGQLCPLGTGDFDVMINEAKLAAAVPTIEMADQSTDVNSTHGLSKTGTGSETPGADRTPFAWLSPGPMTPLSPGGVGSEFNGSNLSLAAANAMEGMFSPQYEPQGYHGAPLSPMSPNYNASGPLSPGGSRSVYSPSSPLYPMSPVSGAAGSMHTSGSGNTGSGLYSPTSPLYSATSPMVMSPTSPIGGPGARSARGRAAAGRGGQMTSPAYSPTSPTYSVTSPGQHLSPTSPAYSPTSPAYSPTSPAYSPTSPGAGGVNPTSPAYSPTSPAYSPTSPAYNPQAAAYNPTSPAYSPTSPQYSPAYSPTSPNYNYNPMSPAYNPQSPVYSPTSPNYEGPAGQQQQQAPQSPDYSNGS